MMLKLQRIAKKAAYTIGRLYCNGAYIADTLEDTDRGLTSEMSLDEIMKKKVHGQTAIPAGLYIVNTSMVSPRFRTREWAKPFEGKIPRIMNVKGFDGVLIHPGNKAEDTEGCILVGKNEVIGGLVSSLKTFNALMGVLKHFSDKNEQIYIQII